MKHGLNPVVKYGARFILAHGVVLVSFFVLAMADYKGNDAEEIQYLGRLFRGSWLEYEILFLIASLFLTAGSAFIVYSLAESRRLSRRNAVVKLVTDRFKGSQAG